MSFNPYQSPSGVQNPAPTNSLQAPAIALLIVAGISIVLLLLATAGDVFMLATGIVDRLEQAAGGDKHAQVYVRIVWGLLIVISNVGTVIGALQMLSLNNRMLAYAGCILACIPCFSPCLILGIPFGIWGLIAMADERVKRSFQS